MPEKQKPPQKPHRVTMTRRGDKTKPQETAEVKEDESADKK